MGNGRTKSRWEVRRGSGGLARPVRRRLAWTVAMLLAGACSRSRIDHDLSQPSRTRVERPGIVIHSPFDEAGTAPLIETVEREQAQVAELLAVDGSGVELRLVPVDTGAEPLSLDWLLANMHPGRDGYAGWGGLRQDGVGLAVVYVPTDPMLAGFASEHITGVVRHELVHALAPRAGLPSTPRWFAEGLATAVQVRELDGRGGLVREGLTPDVSLLEALAPAVPLETVLDWPAWDGGHADGLESRRYGMAASFVDFLLGQRDELPFREAAAAVAALSREELLAQESSWRAWLSALDPVGEVQALSTSSRPGDAERALQRLRVLVLDMRWPGAAGARADAVALAALEQPALRDSAFTYLGLARARALPPDVVAALAGSDDPELWLMGAALRFRRDEPVDSVAVQRCWQALSRDAQLRLGFVSHFLGLELAPPADRAEGSMPTPARASTHGPKAPALQVPGSVPVATTPRDSP